MTDNLILTKLYIPRPRAALVRRPRLIERLEAGLPGKLTLLSAPPGFGKTTLLSDWARQGKRPTAWLTLDERDNDPVRFLTYLIAAWQTVYEEVGQTAREMLLAQQRPDYEVILTSLINDLAEAPGSQGQPAVLIVDDYQQISTQPVLEASSFLLDFLPPQAHLVIASRSDPDLPLGRLRVSGQLNEVRAADLRFSREEIGVFFEEALDLQLAAKDIDSLSTRTEGWVAGLQVAALSIKGRDDISGFIHSFTGSNRYILEYLIEEVLARQPEAIQSFLIQTSILDRLSGPLCDVVVGQGSGSQAVLEGLVAANLFVAPLDDERRWYRYHPLFAEFLRSYLRATRPNLVPALQQRAACWLADNGQLAEAVDQALAAGVEELTLRLVARAAKEMIVQGEWRTLQRWLDALPGEEVGKRPRLALAQAWAMLYSAPAEVTESWLRAAEEQLPPLADSDAATLALRGEIGALRATMASAAGDTRQTIEIGREALQYLPDDERFLRTAIVMAMGYAYRYSGDIAAAQAHFERVIALSEETGNRYQVLDGLCNLANQQLAQGRPRAASETAERALQIMESRGGKPPAMASEVYLIYGVIWYEKNDLEAAGRFVAQALALSAQAGMGELLYSAYFWSSLVALAQGDEAAARRQMEAAGQVAEKLNNRRAARHVAAGRVRLWLALGELGPVRRWIAEIEAAERGEAVELAPIREYEELTLAQAYLALGRSEATLVALARLRPGVEVAGRGDNLYQIEALQSLALAGQGEMAAALAALAQLLPQTAAEGYVRLYVDLGRPMASLLQQAVAAGIEPVEAQRLLRAFEGGAGADAGTAEAAAVRLTRREQEVLGLIADGRSNQQIANELVISLGTVKRHISNIFHKLGVRRRTQAVARARELELYE